MNLEQQIESLKTRQDLATFVLALAEDYDTLPDSWENDHLSVYLKAIAAWVSDMDGYFQNRGETVPEQPTWRLLASILLAAKHYE
jgi:hypothetical protein